MHEKENAVPAEQGVGPRDPAVKRPKKRKFRRQPKVSQEFLDSLDIGSASLGGGVGDTSKRP